MSEESDEAKKAKEAWDANKGRLARLSPEERSEFGRKGAIASNKAQAKRRDMQTRLKDKQGMLNEAVAAVMAEDPELLQKVFQNIAIKAANPEDDKALMAAEMLLKHSGITAPKQQEVQVEDNRSIEETVTELENLGANVFGLKKLKG